MVLRDVSLLVVCMRPKYKECFGLFYRHQASLHFSRLLDEEAKKKRIKGEEKNVDRHKRPRTQYTKQTRLNTFAFIFIKWYHYRIKFIHRIPSRQNAFVIDVFFLHLVAHFRSARAENVNKIKEAANVSF